MPEYINVSVSGNVARAEPGAFIVCGYNEYYIKFDFDFDYSKYDFITARFIWNGHSEDRVFIGDECEVPEINDTNDLYIGILANDKPITSTLAHVWCKRSATDKHGKIPDPREDVYTQIIKLLNEKKPISAYDLAVEHGFKGSVEEWLDSLVGASAYEIAVEHGFEGSEEEWLDSLVELTKLNAQEVIELANAKIDDLNSTAAAGKKAVEDAEDKAVEHLNDLAEGAYDISQYRGQSSTQVMSQEATTDNLTPLETIFVPQYNGELYFESDPNGFNPVYFKFSSPAHVLYLRGFYVTTQFTMQNFVDTLPAAIVTSPKGIEGCLKIDHNCALVWDRTTNKVGYTTNTGHTAKQIPIFKVSSGRVVGGIGLYVYDKYIAEQTASKIVDNAVEPIKNDINNIKNGNEIAAYFQTEVNDCISKLVDCCKEKSFVFSLVTDSHRGNNTVTLDMWNDTLKNVKAVNSAYKLDAIYHLGDLVDGNLTKEETTAHISKMRNDMYAVNPETYILMGNHEDNSFTTDHEYQYTKAELYSILCRFKDVDTVRPSNKLYWYKDMHTMGIRVICLDSHMGEGTYGSGTSWGYPQVVVDWVRDTALNTSYQVVFLSHMPVTGAFNAYGLQPVNGVALRTVIENFKANGGTVIGLFHGHTHWDFLGKANTNGFYEVSTGCSINGGTYVPDYAPEGATFPVRGSGIANDLWDIVVIQPTERKVKMIRFGAGDDREFTY